MGAFALVDLATSSAKGISFYAPGPSPPTCKKCGQHRYGPSEKNGRAYKNVRTEDGALHADACSRCTPSLLAKWNEAEERQMYGGEVQNTTGPHPVDKADDGGSNTLIKVGYACMYLVLAILLVLAVYFFACRKKQ